MTVETKLRIAEGTNVLEFMRVPDEFGWRVRPRRADETFVVMEGALNAASRFDDLDELVPAGARVVLNMMRINRVSSEGLLRFSSFVRRASETASEIVVECCSVAVVERLNQAPELLEHLTIHSLVAPLECPRCSADAETRVRVAADRGEPDIPWQSCVECGAGMVLASPRDRYFAFLSR